MFYFLIKIAATFPFIFLPTVKRKTIKTCDINLKHTFMKQRCKVDSSCKITCPRRYNYEGKLSTNYISEKF